MENAYSMLVHTKIAIPRQRTGVVLRHRLLEFADMQRNADIYMVHAPAGYGKTTLLLDWIQRFRENNISVSWYALDAGDNEKSTFAMYFINSLSMAIANAKDFESILQRLRSTTDLDLLWLIKSVINLFAGMNLNHVVVFDDYHEIKNKDIHEALSYFLEYLPAGIKVIISTRSTPPFPIARWRVRARLCEVDQDHLKFESAEVTKFLSEVMKLKLSDEQIALITERTEGWAAGLQLAGINLIGKAEPEVVMQSFKGSQQVLLPYLMEEVYAHLPEYLQQFLLRTALFPRFSAELCNSILSLCGTAETLIDEVKNSHLFLVELDDQHTWFRYHHLFSEFLVSRLRNEKPDEQRSLHLQASNWFKEKQLYREAVEQAFLSKDIQYTASLVCELGFYMIIHSEISILYEWTSIFAEEVMQANPLLCILQSWALVYRYQKQNRMRIESRLKQAEQAISTLTDEVEAANLTEHLAIVRTFLAMAPDPDVNIFSYLENARQMLTPYPVEHPGQYSALLTMAYAYLALQEVEEAEGVLLKARQAAYNGQLFFGFVEATFHLARLKLACGKLQEAGALCRNGKAEIKAMLPNAEQLLPALGSLDIVLGCVLLEENRLTDAFEHLQNGLKVTGSGSNPFYLFVAYDALAKCSLFLGDRLLAEKILNQLGEQWPDIQFYVRGMLYWIHLFMNGQLADFTADAQAWCDEMDLIFSKQGFVPGMGPLGAAEIYYHTALNWMYIKIALGKPFENQDLFLRLQSSVQKNEIYKRVLDLDMTNIFAHWVNGNEEIAVKTLSDICLSPAARMYYHGINFGSILQDMITYMERDAGFSAVPSILVELKQGWFVKKVSESDLKTMAQSAIIEPLSDRELEVLKLIAQGASNQDIAGTLFITVGTVKSHINHILRKLNARNRTEAVSKAREIYGL